MKRREITIDLAVDSVVCNVSAYKVDRSEIYGSSTVRVIDAAGRECERSTICEDGRTIAAARSRFMFDESTGRAVKESDTTFVGDDGQELPVHEGFSKSTAKGETCSIEKVLEYKCDNLYAASFDEELCAELVSVLTGGDAVKFLWTYRSTVNPATAFLVMAADGKPYILIGWPAVDSLFEAPQIAEPDETDPEEEGDELDFESLL